MRGSYWWPALNRTAGILILFLCGGIIGFILAEQHYGEGKTWAAILWPLLSVNSVFLIALMLVAPRFVKVLRRTKPS